MMQSKRDITDVLNSWAAGQPRAVDELMPIVYQELKRLARRQLHRNPGARPTFDTTALVHEAYLKFVDQPRVDLAGRAHFYAVAARAMRQVLVDQARRRSAAKRGGGESPIPLEEDHLSVATEVESVLALEQALEGLGRQDERSMRVVECRFFAGMSVAETALALGISERTVERDWMQAKGWLRQHLEPRHVELLSQRQPRI